jgi:pilus assembly protein Flp/PilA
MKNLFSRFLKDESGATAIEYGLIAAGISVVIIAAVRTLGTTLNGVFTGINGQLATPSRQPGTLFASDRTEATIRVKRNGPVEVRPSGPAPFA